MARLTNTAVLMSYMPTFAMILAIAGCHQEPSSIAASKRLIEGRLKDPSSVEYRNVRSCGKDGQWAAGEYNAKNSFGAYVGFQPFIYDGDRIHVDGDGTTPPTWLCNS